MFTEPAACAMHGLETLNVRPGATALVFGAGPTGLLLAQLIKSGGAASVTVAAPTQFKLDTAKALGVDHTVQIDREDAEGNQEKLLEASGGDGYDYVVEATGSTVVGDICVSADPERWHGPGLRRHPSGRDRRRSIRSTSSVGRSRSRAPSPR